jgi:hypothetical protein
MNREEFDRAKFTDRYAHILAAQNAGERCEYCGSLSGHLRQCGLLNRNTAEAHATLFTPTEADVIAAHALGIDLTR